MGNEGITYNTMEQSRQTHTMLVIITLIKGPRNALCRNNPRFPDDHSGADFKKISDCFRLDFDGLECFDPE